MKRFVVQYTIACDGWEEVDADTEQDARDKVMAKRNTELIFAATTKTKMVNTVEEQENADGILSNE